MNNNNNNNTTSLVEIKTLEKEVDMLIAQYNQMHAQVIVDVQKGTSDVQANLNLNIKLMKVINDKILTLLSLIKNKTTSLYPEGIHNHHVIRMNNKHLRDISKKLAAQQYEVSHFVKDNDTLDGKNKSLTLQLVSNYYHYLFYFIILLLLFLYAFNMYGILANYDSVDIIILICASLLLVYHFMGPSLTYMKEGSDYVVRRLTNLSYLF